MNLTTDKWIPIIWTDGRYDKVSLLDIFRQGDRIADLAVRPHERIALMRLLICIAQAALDGPADRDDWKACLPRIAPAATDYLNQWQRSFELFGDGPRFLQLMEIKSAKVGKGDDNSPSKLDMALATGSNTTLFDNQGAEERQFSPDYMALALLTFQNFSPGGLIGDMNWLGRHMGRSSNNAPCVMKAMIHSYIRKDCLLATVHANLLNKEFVNTAGQAWGCPIWEAMPSSPDDKLSNENATATYLGRLVPLSRLIRLDSDGRGMILGAGWIYESGWREAASTRIVKVINKKDEVTDLGASPEKAIWREAHSLAVVQKTAASELSGPLALGQADLQAPVDLWSGALVAKKSKLIDTVESVLRLPPAMFSDQGQNVYRAGVQQAETWARKLSKAIAKYHKWLNDDLEKKELRKRGDKVKEKAAAHYWTAVEQHVPDLLQITENPDMLYPDGASKACWSKTPWGQALARQARAAYDLACPHESPRNMQAYVEGLKSLYVSYAKPEETAP